MGLERTPLESGTDEEGTAWVDRHGRVAAYPDTATVSPHLFRPLAVPGICVA